MVYEGSFEIAMDKIRSGNEPSMGEYGEAIWNAVFMESQNPYSDMNCNERCTLLLDTYKNTCDEFGVEDSAQITYDNFSFVVNGYASQSMGDQSSSAFVNGQWYGPLSDFAEKHNVKIE